MPVPPTSNQRTAMILSSFLVRNFRNLEEVQLELESGIFLFLGLNAQGKTNLIEAILFLATAVSHRTHREEELIRWGEATAFLRGEMRKNQETTRIECGLEKQRKVIKIDGVVLPRMGDLYGHLRTVLFAPEDIQIVSGSPQDRRRFLDMAIAQQDPTYIPLLHNYRKALGQRNSVLKHLQQSANRTNFRELEVWDQPFLDSAAQVTARRCEMLKHLHPLAQDLYAGLADDGPFAISPAFGEGMTGEEIRAALYQKLLRLRIGEIERGSTQIGPHRDDILFLLNKKSLAHFGSQGQRRAAALALRLAESRLCFARTGVRPLLLIDDVVYEMDNTRRARFWKLMDLSGQLIITATDREHLGHDLSVTRLFQVNQGKITPV